MAEPDRPLAIYVHWPFCLSKCPYCDFNSHVAGAVDHDRWRTALCRELDHYAEISAGRTVTSVFFGGGTPSLMAPATAAGVLDRIAHHWPLADDIEITLEANPTSVEAGRLADFRGAGVNRTSLGVQALDDDALRFLGRGHDSAEAIAAVATARRIFDRHSIDLIYARPGQTVADWRAELTRGLDLIDDHISVYQLTIEKGTPFHAAHRDGAFALPDDETGLALFEVTQRALAAAGLPAYEISNHARPGAESRHNLSYWRGHDYLGIGPGAHGRLTDRGRRRAFAQLASPAHWLERVAAEGHATVKDEALAPDAAVGEAVMMGLRLVRGIDAGDFRCATGLDLGQALPGARLAKLVAGGWLAQDAHGIRLTEAGRPLLNTIISELMA